MKIRKIIGLAGVAQDENLLARTWGKRFEVFMIVIAIWLPLQWYLQRVHALSAEHIYISNWLVWSFFVMEMTTLLFLVVRKGHYLLKNWMSVVIILISFPIVSNYSQIGVMVRLILMLGLLLPWYDTGVAILSRNRLGTTLMISCIITLLWGILMSVVDPSVHTPWDGIWWAWETVTTLGYGDIVPTSVVGRVLGILLMIMGVGLISLLTANFSAYFIDKSNDAIKKEEDEILLLLKDMQRQLSQIQDRLQRLEQSNR